ncbi:sugar phosphate isomerase/epimerase family protein [Paenibacillus piri]|uniref:Sugar phosphate isomerase/epimerase n=1 Tax=Paenibacillus piri TaxID=2547395 RepID=A0A4R5KQS3_9BACL|nr:sugar phosphate isomerase/epimerase family protein [Paenibacillus piri]TDF98119.1 sugar phosphate isomerase/epimerase [Paenibacillus piri]
MLLTCKENMIRAAHVSEACAIIKEAGFDGIDFMGGTMKQQLAEARQALRDTGLATSAVYGQLGQAGSSLIDQTAWERARALDLFKERIEAAAEVGAGQLIFVPRFGIPSLRAEAAEWILVTMLEELGEWAADIPVTLVMEPLNRNESQFLYDPLHALRITEAVDRSNVKTMVDTYHMDVEGQDMSALIRELDDAIAVVHASDTERKLPGLGEIDFRTVVQALKSIGYNGPVGFECKEADAADLKASVSYLRKLWAEPDCRIL